MERSNFVENAPIYYAAAIYAYVRNHNYSTELDIKNHWTGGSEASEGYQYLRNAVLFRHGIRWLVEKGLVAVIADNFGPAIYQRASDAYPTIIDLSQEVGSIFWKLDTLGWNYGWIREAIESVNDTYQQLGITDADFERPDSEWEPLPLDRSDPLLENALVELDSTVELVRGENGYAANLPEERGMVLRELQLALTVLKTEPTTSIPFLKKHLFEPLGIIIKRFKNAALATIASGVRAAVIEYIKQHGPAWVASLLNHL